MSKLFVMAIVWAILIASGVAALFGVMYLVGLSSTAGDKYGPLARILGCIGVGLLIPAFKFGMWRARRRQSTSSEGRDDHNP